MISNTTQDLELMQLQSRLSVAQANITSLEAASASCRLRKHAQTVQT